MEPNDLTADSPMGVILETLPGARRAIFAKYHLGGCQSCAFSNEETLGELCQRCELDVAEVMDHLLTSYSHDSAMWMDPKTAKSRQGELLFVDLRTREEHETVVIENSEFFTQELQQKLFGGDHKRMILLYDHTGQSALDQVAWFRGHGLIETYALSGGIDGWSREVDPSLGRYRVEMA